MKNNGSHRLASSRLHAALASLPQIGLAAALASSAYAQTTIVSGENLFPDSASLGALTRNAGGTALFTGTATLSASSTLTNGLLPWGIVQNSGAAANNSTNGYTFATITSGNIAAYTGATALSGSGAWGGIPSGGTGTINYDVSGTMAVTGLSRNVNTIRYTGTGATQAGNINSVANLLTTNGFMNSGTGTFFIGGTGGSNNYGINVTAGTSNELVLAAMTADIVLRNGILNGSGGNSPVTVLGGSATRKVTISGTTSNYSGATYVNSGTLEVSGSGSINTTSGINVNGSTAKYLHTSSAASTRTVTLVQGTVDGTGTLGTVNVADNALNVIANGNGGTSTLTVGNLTFNGDATINAKFVSGSKPINVTGALATTPANGTVALNVASSGFTNGLNNIIGFGSFAGSISDFTLGSVTGTNSRQSVGALSMNGSNVALTINGDNPKWTGAQSGAWTTNTIGGASNWSLATAGTATDYLVGDEVLFDDTATGNTTVDISTANVAPASVIFNNSSKSYTLSSSGGFGISGGSLVKNGSGTVTVTNTNTYTGTTTINGGTLQIGDGTTDGSIVTSSGIANNGTLAYNLAGNQTYSGAITGSGNVSKSGSGILTLAGANTYAGGTTINGGTIATAANLGSANSSVVINAGGTLALTAAGTLTNTVTGTGAVISTGATLTGDWSAFSGTYTHNSTTASSSINSPTATSRNTAYTIASEQGSSQGMIAGYNTGSLTTAYTLEMGSLSGVANSLLRGGNGAQGLATFKVGNLNTNTTFAGIIADGANTKIGLTKVGTGSLTLSGNSTYTQATSVEQGSLFVNGALGNSAVTVSALTGTATLGGSGTIGGATTIGNNGILSAGNSPGVLSFTGNLTLGSGSTSIFEINGLARGTEYDGVNVGGVLTYGGGINLVFGTPVAAGTYDLFGGSFTSQSGDFASVSLDGSVSSPVITAGTGWSLLSGGWQYDFVNATGDLTITSAIPEPSSFAAFAGLACLGLVGLRRRRA